MSAKKFIQNSEGVDKNEEYMAILKPLIVEILEKKYAIGVTEDSYVFNCKKPRNGERSLTSYIDTKNKYSVYVMDPIGAKVKELNRVNLKNMRVIIKKNMGSGRLFFVPSIVLFAIDNRVFVYFFSDSAFEKFKKYFALANKQGKERTLEEL